MSVERLQKILARAGYGSRRDCEGLITAGRVAVNGKVAAELGGKADPEKDDIRCDGERVRAEKKVYYLLNKPRGYVCTNEDELGRLRAIDLLRGVAQRVYTVGRLDKDSEGLIILTNDGGFANLISHPRYGVAKIYMVEVNGIVTGEERRRLAEGLHLSEGRAALERVELERVKGGMTLLEVTLREGKNREIRRVLAGVGHSVRRLKRVAIGPISDPKLRRGEYRPLRKAEVDELIRVVRNGRQRVDTARKR